MAEGDDELALAIRLSLEQHEQEEQARIIAGLEAADASARAEAEADAARARLKREKAQAKQAVKAGQSAKQIDVGCAVLPKPLPATGTTLCASCGQHFGRHAFSSAQLRKDACKRCCRSCCDANIEIQQAGRPVDLAILQPETKVYITGLKYKLYTMAAWVASFPTTRRLLATP